MLAKMSRYLSFKLSVDTLSQVDILDKPVAVVDYPQSEVSIDIYQSVLTPVSRLSKFPKGSHFQ
jgi:hypothetical protein